MKQKTKTYAGVIILAYIAFIALGMPDGLGGVAWPSMRAGFGQPLDALGMLLVACVLGYMTSSFFNGKLINLLGVGGLLTASCALTGTALIGYTLVPQWWMMVLLGVAAGLGAGAIDAGLNTYIASHFSDRVMQWLHASYGIGITLGPLIMTGALNLFDSWKLGYRVVGAFQLLLAVIFLFTLRMWRKGVNAGRQQEITAAAIEKSSYRETLKKPAVWISLLLFVVYTGSEVSLGTWAYSLLTEARNVTPAVAGFIAGSYWAMFTVGRILAGFLTRRIGLHRLVRISLLGALLGAILVWWNPSSIISAIGVALIGFSIAPIFPALVSGTEGRVGKRFTANTIGMQMSAAGFGSTILPGLMGILARRSSLEAVPIVLTCAYAILLGLYQLSLRQRQQETAQQKSTR